MGRLTGRVGLVTGAAGGLGSAMAKRLAREGAHVVVTDVREPEARKVADEITATGGRAVALAHDVTDPDAWQHVIGTAETEFGGLGILVNNAGIGNFAGIEEITIKEYEKVIAVSQTSVFLGLKSAAAALKASGHGSVINISSICGVTGTTGRSISYHAAKGAVGQMTKNTAIRWATQGVRVNSVHPGYIGTEPVLAKSEEVLSALVASTPMGRLGEPDEIASVVAFLASDDSSFVTGTEIHVDGGFLAR
ncbi:SDR family NAD(P)-dependent oxidoreductase [Rhodococcus sp. NPDC127528]|uniref:SDR family NAD(P)-dependent oxidoreductase n=1 Tax=unclassified Rhodococcus (in: high G+C Gram-positive bacteria) TaxID=192944 RepID=UPI003641E65F